MSSWNLQGLGLVVLRKDTECLAAKAKAEGSDPWNMEPEPIIRNVSWFRGEDVFIFSGLTAADTPVITICYHELCRF